MASVQIAALKGRFLPSQAFERVVELMSQRRGIPEQQPADQGGQIAS